MLKADVGRKERCEKIRIHHALYSNQIMNGTDILYCKLCNERLKGGVDMKIMDLVIVSCAVGLLLSCSSNQKANIIGKWDNDGIVVEFSKDGKIVLINPDGSTPDSMKTSSGKYEFIGGDTIKYVLDGVYALGGTHIEKVSITENELTMTAEDGTVSKFRRVK